MIFLSVEMMGANFDLCKENSLIARQLEFCVSGGSNELEIENKIHILITMDILTRVAQ